MTTRATVWRKLMSTWILRLSLQPCRNLLQALVLTRRIWSPFRLTVVRKTRCVPVIFLAR
ncbi:Uncharacterised protein [Vibrio cholerae]|nr:Uncharacterised protein [Vibrio cholerae]